MEAVSRLQQGLEAIHVRTKLDDRDGVTPGFKFNDWEMRGVPLRIEISPGDLANGTIALARRDIPGRKGKQFLPMAGYQEAVPELLANIQDSLLRKATQFRDSHIFEVETYEDFKEVVETKGWAKVWWYDDPENEAKIKADTKATLRNYIPDVQGEGTCV